MATILKVAKPVKSTFSPEPLSIYMAEILYGVLIEA